MGRGKFKGNQLVEGTSRPTKRFLLVPLLFLELLDRTPQTQNNFGRLENYAMSNSSYLSDGLTGPVTYVTDVTYVRDVATTSELLKRLDVDAIEMHTSGRKTDMFKGLWNSLGDSISHLKLVAG